MPARLRIAPIARQLLAIGSAIMCFSFMLLRNAAAVLSAAPDPTDQEDALTSAIRGGDFNYRTDRFDDGTDPAGLYDRD